MGNHPATSTKKKSGYISSWTMASAQEDESEDDPDSRRGRGPPHEVAPQVVSPVAGTQWMRCNVGTYTP